MATYAAIRKYEEEKERQNSARQRANDFLADGKQVPIDIINQMGDKEPLHSGRICESDRWANEN